MSLTSFSLVSLWKYVSKWKTRWEVVKLAKIQSSKGVEMAIAGEKITWEYLVVDRTQPLLTAGLNKLGEDGWQLTGYAFIPLIMLSGATMELASGRHSYVFMRRKYPLPVT